MDAMPDACSVTHQSGLSPPLGRATLRHMKPAEVPMPEAEDPRLARVVTLFQEGDYKSARAALAGVPHGELRVDDQLIHERLAHSLKMEPLFVYGLVGSLLLWVYLWATNTG